MTTAIIGVRWTDTNRVVGTFPLTAPNLCEACKLAVRHYSEIYIERDGVKIRTLTRPERGALIDLSRRREMAYAIRDEIEPETANSH
ncbi:hypothetical protein G8E10_24935 [Rhizobiaceae bacterium CRRU44]|uniref:Uncharacterized protein n=1 Tax=Ferranicluibacter rubi TaxID=2715133 RepID=A0AA44CDI6_9HYPH|nr:hypothetical protein [Ferranicluibacter rubi]NHT78949.1 hypothetical protein [Ferranicluibacter rubi]